MCTLQLAVIVTIVIIIALEKIIAVNDHAQYV